MKQLHSFLLAILLAIVGVVSMQAETVDNYVCDFNTPINTSTHNFKVASNWKHIVGKISDSYGDYYMDYSYKTDEGVDGSGALYCPAQTARVDNYSSPQTVTDLLITPKVSGNVKLYVRKEKSGAYVDFIAINDEMQPGESLMKASSDLVDDEYVEVSLNLEEAQCIGLRCHNVTIDNFSADQAEIELEKSMSIESVVPGATSGVIYHDQQPDGSIQVKFTVTVKNTCEYPITQGEKNFSVSLVYRKTGEVLGRVRVPQSLQPGETSEPFDVVATIAKNNITSYWSYSGATINIDIKEDLSESVKTVANQGYKEWKHEIWFRPPGGTNKNINKDPIVFGIVTENTTKEYTLFNNGVAPVYIKSITVPNGFAMIVPEGDIVVNNGETLNLPLTLNADVPGSYSGNFEIVYIDNNGSDTTLSIPVSGAVAASNAWVADFNPTSGSLAKWPAGAATDSGIDSDYTYSNGVYNRYMSSYTNAEREFGDNKFITPKLNVMAGDCISFDVASKSYSTSKYNLKLYVSQDRYNWGEPVMTITSGSFTDNKQFRGESYTFPETGEYYVAFANYGMYVDNIVAPEAIIPAHDLYIRSFVVNPDAVDAGDTMEAIANIVPVTDETAQSYVLKFHYGDLVMDTEKAVALTASCTSNKELKYSYTPKVTESVTVPCYLEFVYEDGTTISTPVVEKTIKVEPAFVFVKKGATVNKYNQTSEKSAVNFGKVNQTGLTMNYEIANWGGAPLTIKSVEMPEGFSVSYEGGVIEPRDGNNATRQAFDIVLSAQTAGIYSGDLKITYVNAEGEDVVYTLPLTANFLDPNKWYQNFDSNTWPAGSLHEDGATFTSPTTGNYALYGNNSKSSGKGMFITPKLHAEAGETLSFDARIYSTSWKEGTVDIYAAPTREMLADDANRMHLASLCGNNTVEGTILTPDYQTFNVTFEEAGDYYVGISLYSRTYVDELYGLSLVPVEHEWTLVESTIPSSAVQNNWASGSVKVRNTGLTNEEAGEYQVTAYVNGEAQTVDATVPMVVMSDTKVASCTTIPVSFRSPKKGTFPVYFEVSASDYKVATEPVEVTFSEEVLSAEKQVGESNNEYSATDSYNLYYWNSESLALYTPSELGLSAGEKISAIKIKGYGSKANYTTKLRIYYGFTSESTLTVSADKTVYDYENSGLTKYFDGDFTWPDSGATVNKPCDMFTLKFDEPLTYEDGQNFVLYIGTYTETYASNTYYIEKSTSKENTYFHQSDVKVLNDYNHNQGPWKKNDKYKPVLHLDMVVEARSLSGNVTDGEGAAVEGAVVTLISNDGDNVQYETTTDAEGNYSVNVIQSGREYDVEVAGEEMMEFDNGVSFADASQERDFTLRPVIVIADDREHNRGAEDAVVYLNTIFTEGFNAVALPIALDAEEVADIFGEDAIVMEWDGDSGEAAVNVNFAETHNGMEAGVPYLLWLSEDTKPIRFISKEVVETFSHRNGTAVNFKAAAAPTPLAEGMFVLTEDNFVPANNKMREAQIIPAYHAYVEANNANVKSLTFTTDANIETAVEEIEGVSEGEDMIYTIDGIRVKNPAKGLYIVNGKMVIVK